MKNKQKFYSAIFALLFLFYSFAGCSGSSGGSSGVNPEENTNSVVLVTGVELDFETLTVNVTKTVKLTATVNPENATNKSITWSTSDASKATVDQNGNVKGIEKGSATITVSTNDGNKTASCEVTVNPPATEKFNGPYLLDGKKIEIKNYDVFDENGRKIGMADIDNNGDVVIEITVNADTKNYFAKTNSDGTLKLDSVKTTDENGNRQDVEMKILELYYIKYFYENANDSGYTENCEQKLERVASIGDVTAVTADEVAGFQTPIIDQITVTENSYNVVTVKYARKIITLTFNLDGGNGTETVSGKYESTVAVPESPIKTGYTFNGWTPVIPDVFPLENATYIAQWMPNTSVITVSIQPESDITSITSVIDKVADTVTITAPSGYSNYSWRIDGVLQSSNVNEIVLGASSLTAGLHQVFLMIDNCYSSTIIIAIEK